MTLPHNHPKKFAIRDPSGEWFYIVDDARHLRFLSSKEFEHMTSWSVEVASVKGMRYVNGVATVEYVFGTPGTYMLYVADNLDTEPENTYSLSADVTFIAR